MSSEIQTKAETDDGIPNPREEYECEIKVFTLNCWGLKGVSDKRSERITAIANCLRQSPYDVVLLQEVRSHF